MKHINRLVPVLAGVVTVSGAWGIVAVGCSSSSSTSSPEDAGGTDSTTTPPDDVASQADVGQVVDAMPGVDANVGSDADAAPGPDADAGSDADAGPGSEADAGSDADAAPGLEADAGSDADAGVADSSVPLNAQTFPPMLATAFCNTIASCCGSSGDAASFNWQSCYNTVLASGFKGINTTGANLNNGANIAFNIAQAQTCLSTIASADCTANQITSAEQIQLYQDCYGAYSGTLATGAPCAATIECAPGNFCMPLDGGAGDAGAIGLCQALAGVGGACGFLGPQSIGQTVCSYRGSASDGLFCQNISGEAGTTQLSSAQWTCQAQWANGSDCYANQDCTSRLCVQVGTTSAFQCGSGGEWAYPNTCALYVAP